MGSSLGLKANTQYWSAAEGGIFSAQTPERLTPAFFPSELTEMFFDGNLAAAEGFAVCAHRSCGKNIPTEKKINIRPVKRFRIPHLSLS
jgi:hypothetical protein